MLIGGQSRNPYIMVLIDGDGMIVSLPIPEEDFYANWLPNLVQRNIYPPRHRRRETSRGCTPQCGARLLQRLHGRNRNYGESLC